MSARYISSSLIGTVTGKPGRNIILAVVDKTTDWTRPSSFPSERVKQAFARIAKNNIDKFKAGVVKIAMKESAHQSDRDKRIHYTAYGLDANDDVVDVQHLLEEV